MAVRKIKSSWWVDFTFRRRRYRLRSPDNHRDGASRYEGTLRSRLADGKGIYLATDPRVVTDVPPTLDEFATTWFETYARPRVKPMTFISYTQRYRNHLRPGVGNLRLDAINAVAIDRLVARLVGRPLHPKSINNVLGVLRRMLATAVEWGKLERIPPIKWLKAPPSRFTFLSPLEADRLIECADREPWRLMIQVALHTGLRLGELMSLRWTDVDLERRQLCVRRSITQGVESSPKNNRIRFVPLTRELCAVLARCPRIHEHVIERHGCPVTQSTAWNGLQDACKRAGIRPVGWHALRHTFASHLVAENVPIVAVQSFLGHSDIKMTQRYAHIAPSMLRGFIEGVVTARTRARAELRQPVVNPSEPGDRQALETQSQELVCPLT